MWETGAAYAPVESPVAPTRTEQRAVGAGIGLGARWAWLRLSAGVIDTGSLELTIKIPVSVKAVPDLKAGSMFSRSADLMTG
jgi:hypothetical protein